MAHQITWSPKADAIMYKTTAFLAENWPESVVDEFIDNVFKAVDLLQEYPEIGQKTAKSNTIRSYLVKPYTRLIYRIKPGKIVILRLVDTRQKPGRRNF